MKTMNVTEFQEDLRAGMTIHDALIKHGLTFKEAMETLQGRPKKRALPMYINRNGKGFVIKRKRGKKTIYYGIYKTLEDAVRMKEHMQKNGWYKKRLKKYREELGIPAPKR